MSEVNRRIVLAQRPVGMIEPTCFRSEEVPVPTPGEGEALVRNIYLSLDPTIRGWLNEEDTYLPAVQIGEVVRSGGIGEVVASNAPEYAVGDLVFGLVGWQDYAIAAPTAPMNVLPPGVPPTAALSVFGVTGMTAYFGLLDLGAPAEGETVVVSGAAGATGSVVGQIARIKGCRVIGIAGTDAKCSWLTDELGFDAAINYRTEKVPERLRETCPRGVDVFFDNVGGDILEAVLDRINLRARVVLCGAISQYNEVEPQPGPRNLMRLVVQRARMEGFIILDYLDRFPQAIAEMAGWVASGDVKFKVDIVEGLESAPAAINRLFTGENTGKLVVKLRDEPS